MKDSEIKALSPQECPHCKKVFIAEFISTTPNIAGVYTIEDIHKAKEEVIRRINATPNVSAERKQEVIDWVNEDTTMFSPNDIDDIITGLSA